MWAVLGDLSRRATIARLEEYEEEGKEREEGRRDEGSQYVKNQVFGDRQTRDSLETGGRISEKNDLIGEHRRG